VAEHRGSPFERAAIDLLLRLAEMHPDEVERRTRRHGHGH